jgi:hypothetical protein
MVYWYTLVETESGGDRQGGELSICFGCLNEFHGRILQPRWPISGLGKGYDKELCKTSHHAIPRTRVGGSRSPLRKIRPAYIITETLWAGQSLYSSLRSDAVRNFRLRFPLQPYRRQASLARPLYRNPQGASAGNWNSTSDFPDNASCSGSRRPWIVNGRTRLSASWAAADAVPVAETPFNRAVNAFLHVLIQTCNVGQARLLVTSQTKNRNEAALEDLMSRVSRLSGFVSREP